VASSRPGVEPARPAVDAYVLALVAERTLRADDFGETGRGACRLSIRLAAELAETSTQWRTLVPRRPPAGAPRAELVLQALAASRRFSAEPARCCRVGDGNPARAASLALACTLRQESSQ
jgi:hypothetical protein